MPTTADARANANAEDMTARQLQTSSPAASRAPAPSSNVTTACADENAEETPWWQLQTCLNARVPLNTLAASNVTTTAGNNDCPICLDSLHTKGLFGKATLNCGHAYCLPCLTQYVKTSQHVSGSISCPCCRASVRPPAIIAMADRLGEQAERLGQQETDAAMPRLDHRRRAAPPRRRHSDGSARWFQAGPRLTTADTEALARQAGRAACRLRLCPACHAPIEKNGGCDSMTCPCGHRFQWSQARPLAPCRHCHYNPAQPLLRRHTACDHCSPYAKREAKVLRAVGRAAEVPASVALVASVASIVAVGACVGVAVSAVPAAVFGPLALAYEPVRRTVKPLRKKKNHLAWAAGSGAILTGVALLSVCGCESD